MGMMGYKAFNNDWTCKRFQYKIGETYELGEGETLRMCKCGFHFCKNLPDVFGYYGPYGIKVAQIEALGEIVQEGTKFCTDKIRIIREVKSDEWYKHEGVDNTGSHNSGFGNSGSFNSGNHNTGHNNSGNFNTGVGNCGRRNTGNHNKGDFNVGNKNIGSYNVGAYNRGMYNTGYCNTGDENSGCFNSGDRNSGIFNTNEPTMRMFNKDSGITASEFVKNIDYDFRDFLTRIYENELLPKDYDRIKALPNFDPDIFKEITGIEIERGREAHEC